MPVGRARLSKEVLGQLLGLGEATILSVQENDYSPRELTILIEHPKFPTAEGSGAYPFDFVPQVSIDTCEHGGIIGREVTAYFFENRGEIPILSAGTRAKKEEGASNA